MERHRMAQAIADGFNELGWSVDVPNENGEMKFSANCHEVQTILMKVESSMDKKMFKTIYKDIIDEIKSETQALKFLYTAIIVMFVMSMGVITYGLISEIWRMFK